MSDNETAGRGNQRNQAVGTKRTRRRRFPDRLKMGICQQIPGGSEICGLQCRRRRPGSIYGPFHHGRRPQFHHRGNGHLRIQHRGKHRTGIHPGRIPLGHPAPSNCYPTSRTTRTVGRPYIRYRISLFHPYPLRSGSIRVRRGNSTYPFDGGTAGRTDHQAPLPCRIGVSGKTDQRQQC